MISRKFVVAFLSERGCLGHGLEQMHLHSQQACFMWSRSMRRVMQSEKRLVDLGQN